MINIEEADEEWLRDYKIPKKHTKSILDDERISNENKVPSSLLTHNKIAATTFLPRINSHHKKPVNKESPLNQA